MRYTIINSIHILISIRKNPSHFREYSHGMAAERDSGVQGAGEAEADKLVCPFGVQCYRKNPAHHREYSHLTTGPDTITKTRGRGRQPTYLKGISFSTQNIYLCVAVYVVQSVIVYGDKRGEGLGVVRKAVVSIRQVACKGFLHC